MPNKFYPIVIALLLVGCGGEETKSPPLITISDVGTAPTPAPAPAPTSVVLCTNPHNAEHPTTFNGKFEVPTPAYTLPQSYQRGISFKDYSPNNHIDKNGNRLGGPNCDQEQFVKLMYTQTLDRLKNSGATMLWLYNYAPLKDATASKLSFDEADYQLSNSTIEFIVQEAKKRNIDVYYAWQLHTNDRKGNWVAQHGENISPQALTRLMDAYNDQMIITSKFAQKIGIKGVSADWNAFHIPNLYEANIKEIYTTKTVEVIKNIRDNFSGNVTWGQTGSIYSDPRIIDKVDAIHVSVGGSLLTPNENAFLTVEKVEIAVSKQIKQTYENYKCTFVSCSHTPTSRQIPVFFEIAVQSRDNYWSEGWVEDGFCAKGKLANGTQSDCIQDYYVTDFSVQAIGIEGAMRAITKQSYFKIGGINFHSSYWHTDTLMPGSEGFPNISQSIRGKPAEKIVKYWFTGY
jgi:hypothetical protein